MIFYRKDNIEFFKEYFKEDYEELCRKMSINSLNLSNIPKYTLNTLICINEFKAISDAINYLIKSSGLEERYFNQDELDIINKWYEESVNLYSDIWNNIDNINF